MYQVNNDSSRDTVAPPTDDMFSLVIGAPTSSPSVARKRAGVSLVKHRNNSTNEKRERVPHTREIDFSLDGRQWGER